MALLRPIPGVASTATAVALALVPACSLVNVADEPVPPGTSTGAAGSGGGVGGGAAGGTATGTATGSGGGGGQGPAVCGDGVTGGAEQCDDGGTESGDGCDAECNAEGSCAQPVAIVLSDGGQGTLTGSVTAANVGGPDEVGEALCDGAMAGSGWDRVYRVDLPQTRDLWLELSGDFDMALRLLASPCDLGTAVVERGADGCANQGLGGGSEVLWVPDLPAGTYYAVVDGVAPTAEGTFTLAVTASCPASSLKLTQLDIGANDGLHLVNTSTSCAVDLSGLGVLFDDSTGQDRAVELPDQWLAEGSTLRVARTPPPGHVTSGDFDLSLARGGAAMLCFGACSAPNGGYVIDLVAFSEGAAHPALPTGVSFSPAGLSGVTNGSTYSYLREELTGDYPTFLAADWDVGFRDGFEDGDASDLIVQVGSFTREVTAAEAAVGQYSYTMVGGASHSEGSTIQLAFGQPSHVSFWVRPDATSNARGYFVFRDASDSNGILFFYCSGTSMVLNSTSIGTCQSNTWHHVEFRNLNWSARTCDAYLNGSLAAAGVAFRGSGTSGARIDLYNFSVSSQAWWDEITVKP